MIRADLDPAATGTVDLDANGSAPDIPGYFTSGPVCTIFGPDAANHIQEEIARVITDQGEVLDFSNKGQMSELWDRTTGPYGDGSDGDVTLAIATSLTRDVFYENLTIDPGIRLNLAGRRLYVRRTLTLGDGSIISNNGSDGQDYTGGGTEALGGAGALGFTVGGGGAGGDANSGIAPAPAPSGDDGTPTPYLGYSGAGGAGGVGSPGGFEQGGGSGAPAAGTPNNERPTFVAAMHTGQMGENNAGTYRPFMMAGGAGGGAGGAGSGFTVTDGLGGAGGGGGGVALVCARTIVGPTAPAGAAFIEALGGDGGRDSNAIVAPQGGAGGGGAGGTVLVTSRTRIGDPGLLVLDAGGGSGGLSTVAGNGTDGTSGSVFELFA